MSVCGRQKEEWEDEEEDEKEEKEAEKEEEEEKEEVEEKIKRQGQCWTNRHTSHNQSFPSLGDFLLKESKL